MAGMRGKVNTKGLKEFQKSLDKLNESQRRQWTEAAVKELAARLLAKAIKRTPVGVYSVEIEVTAKRTSKNHKKGDVYKKRVNKSGKVGGTLRRGWTGGKDMKAKDYAETMTVKKVGNTFIIEVINPVEYAPYVEFGHRGIYVPALGKTLHTDKRWTEGKFMLTISEQELQADAPRILTNKLNKFIGDVFK